MNRDRIPDATAKEKEEAISKAKSLHVHQPGIVFVPGAKLQVQETIDLKWYECKIVNVDWGELDIEVHYLKWADRFNEWMKMDSKRIKPSNKLEEQNPYHVGDNVMGYWAVDQRNYPAKVLKIMSSDQCQVKFQDGIVKNLKCNQMSKIHGRPPPIEMLSLPYSAPLSPTTPGQTSQQSTAEEQPTTIYAKDPSKRNIFNVEIYEEKRKPKRKAEVAEMFDNLKRRRSLHSQDCSQPNTSAATKPSRSSDVFPRSTEASSRTSLRKAQSRKSISTVPPTSMPSNDEDLTNKWQQHTACCPSLEKEIFPGWRKVFTAQSPFISMQSWDVMYRAPNGFLIKNKRDLSEYAENNPLPGFVACFDFSTKGLEGLMEYHLKCCVAPIPLKKPKLLIENSPKLNEKAIKLPTKATSDLTEEKKITEEKKVPITEEKKIPITEEKRTISECTKQTICDKEAVSNLDLKSEEHQDDSSLEGDDKMEDEVFEKDQTLEMETPKPSEKKKATITIDVKQKVLAETQKKSEKRQSDELKAEDEDKPKVEKYSSLDISSDEIKINVEERGKAKDVSTPLATETGELDESINDIGVVSGEDESNDEDEMDIISPETKNVTQEVKGQFKGRRIEIPLLSLMKHNNTPPSTSTLAKEPNVVKTSRCDTPDSLERLKANLKRELVIDSQFDVSSVDEHVCPNCKKTFRKLSLLQMHIKHYHPESLEKESDIPNVADLAYARTVGELTPVSSPAILKSFGERKSRKPTVGETSEENKKKSPLVEEPVIAPLPVVGQVMESDSDCEDFVGFGPPQESESKNNDQSNQDSGDDESTIANSDEEESIEGIISPRRDPPASVDKTESEEVEPMETEENEEEEEEDENAFSEDIINCCCGYMEEDGLMLQCDVCLCWQHAACYSIEKDAIPEQYVCSMCSHPRLVRDSRKFSHLVEWLKQGKLPKFSFYEESLLGKMKSSDLKEKVKKGHEVAGTLIRYSNVMHSLNVALSIAKKADHPKLVMWHKKWVDAPPNVYTAEPFPANAMAPSFSNTSYNSLPNSNNLFSQPPQSGTGDAFNHEDATLLHSFIDPMFTNTEQLQELSSDSIASITNLPHLSSLDKISPIKISPIVNNKYIVSPVKISPNSNIMVSPAKLPFISNSNKIPLSSCSPTLSAILGEISSKPLNQPCSDVLIKPLTPNLPEMNEAMEVDEINTEMEQRSVENSLVPQSNVLPDSKLCMDMDFETIKPFNMSEPEVINSTNETYSETHLPHNDMTELSKGETNPDSSVKESSLKNISKDHPEVQKEENLNTSYLSNAKEIPSGSKDITVEKPVVNATLSSNLNETTPLFESSTNDNFSQETIEKNSESAKETSESAEETIEPPNKIDESGNKTFETVEPMDKSVEKIDTTVESIDKVLEPINDTLKPLNETVKPIDETVKPMDETVGQIDTTVEPMDITTKSVNDTVSIREFNSDFLKFSDNTSHTPNTILKSDDGVKCSDDQVKLSEGTVSSTELQDNFNDSFCDRTVDSINSDDILMTSDTKNSKIPDAKPECIEKFEDELKLQLSPENSEKRRKTGEEICGFVNTEEDLLDKKDEKSSDFSDQIGSIEPSAGLNADTENMNNVEDKEISERKSAVDKIVSDLQNINSPAPIPPCKTDDTVSSKSVNQNLNKDSFLPSSMMSSNLVSNNDSVSASLATNSFTSTSESAIGMHVPTYTNYEPDSQLSLNNSYSQMDASIDIGDNLDTSDLGLDLQDLLSSNTVNLDGLEMAHLAPVPTAPIRPPVMQFPEAERIEPAKCKLNLLHHVQSVQDDVEKNYDLLEKQIEALEEAFGLQMDDEDEELESQSSAQLIKLITDDLAIVQKLAELRE